MDVADHQAAAGAQDAEGRLDGAAVVVDVDQDDVGDGEVELPVAEAVQVLGVAHEVGLAVGAFRAGPVDEARREIEAGDLRPEPGEDPAEPPLAAADVEDAPAGHLPAEGVEHPVVEEVGAHRLVVADPVLHCLLPLGLQPPPEVHVVGGCHAKSA